MTANAARAVMPEHIVTREPGTMGHSTLIGALLPAVLHITELAVYDDRHPVSVACAEQFARSAVHGGFATDSGFVWNKPTIRLYGAADPGALAARILAEGSALSAHFTTAGEGAATLLHLYRPGGVLLSEETGLDLLRARLATGRPALPVNAYSVGALVDHRRG
jgi:hypothetical protein